MLEIPGRQREVTDQGRCIDQDISYAGTVLAWNLTSAEQELLLRNAYRVTENRILRKQIKGRVHLSDGERKTLAEIGKKLGTQVLEELAPIVKPVPCWPGAARWWRRSLTDPAAQEGHDMA